MDNPFSWDYLTTEPGPNETFGAFAIGFLILFGAGFILSLVLYSGGGRRFIGDPVLRRMARGWSPIALTIFGVGLFFFLIRVLQISPLSFGMRIWLWLSLLALGLFVLYVIYSYRRNYPEARAAYEERRRKEQYLRSTAIAAGKPATTLASSGSRQVKRRRR